MTGNHHAPHRLLPLPIEWRHRVTRTTRDAIIAMIGVAVVYGWIFYCAGWL